MVVCFCSLSLAAQNSSLYTIRLKSGLLIKCELVKMVPDSFITIRQYDQVSNIACSEVESIEYAEPKSKHTPAADPAPSPAPAPYAYSRRQIVWRNLPDSSWTYGFRLGLGLNRNLNRSYSILFGNSFRFSAMKGLDKRWEAGLSLGLDPYLDPDYEEIIIIGAITAQARCGLVKNKPKRPFLYVDAGYGFNLTSDRNVISTGGVNWAAGFGLSSRSKSQDCIFSFMVGFKTQYIGYERFSFWGGRTNELIVEPVAGIEVRLEWRF